MSFDFWNKTGLDNQLIILFCVNRRAIIKGSIDIILKYQNNRKTLYVNQQGNKEPWYAMGERVRLRSGGEGGDTIYVYGQVSHDDRGNIVGPGDMETQMNQAY